MLCMAGYAQEPGLFAALSGWGIRIPPCICIVPLAGAGVLRWATRQVMHRAVPPNTPMISYDAVDVNKRPLRRFSLFNAEPGFLGLFGRSRRGQIRTCCSNRCLVYPVHRERYVPRQGHPVQFRHLSSLPTFQMTGRVRACTNLFEHLTVRFTIVVHQSFS